MSMIPSSISIRNLSKSFSGRKALDDVSLDIPTGSIFGLLGRNGCGKSTLMGCLLGQVLPDSGDVFIRGYNVSRHRHDALSRVGAQFEAPAFHDHWSGRQNLLAFSRLSGPVNPQRMRQVIEWTGVERFVDQPVRTYSHGMRSRLALALALLPEPEVIVLDEPDDGLDPEGLQELHDLLSRLNREWGMTILFTSHAIAAVEALCSGIGILRNGRLRFAGDWRKHAEGHSLKDFYLRMLV